MRWLSLVLCLSGCFSRRDAAGGQAASDSADLLSTGITGSLTASGPASPTYALSFRPVQRLMLEAVAGPVSRARADSLLRGAPVSLDQLVRLGILRLDPKGYRPDYLVLTVADQRSIYRVAGEYGTSLARAIEARAADFGRLVARYPFAELRPALQFDLVAGMLLNWEGLAITTELGYRAAPRRYPNGDAYLFHSKELGARLPLAGLYWGSESWPGRTMTVTTFGDAESFPRSRGLPNAFDGPFEAGLESLRARPELYGAVRRELLTYLGPAIDDAGAVLERLATAPAGRRGLAATAGRPAERLDATLELLQAIGYVRCDSSLCRPTVPVLIERDRPLVDSTLRIGREVITAWLRANADRIRESLGGLSPLANGLPFALVFSEVWHYVFGFASRTLAEDGFYLNPRAADRPDPGYVGLVWENGLRSP